MDSGFETLIYEKDEEGIAYVTLNRPAALNAYNVQMRDDLYEVLTAIRDDDEVKVVVFKGAGEKAFCAGADLKEFLTAPSPAIARQVRFARDVWGLFLGLPQPLIAALHGYVLGSGVEMALCCDLRIASRDAKFGLPEMGLGIIPGAGGTQTLPRTIGRSMAMEMLLTNRWIDAEEAYQSRLVNMVVPRDELFHRVKGVAEKIASFDQRVVRYAKEALNRGLDLPLVEGLRLEKALFLRLVMTRDLNGASHRTRMEA
ncbi:MAG: enoyl-CoA hydratase/isomerase family protein [Deltaproteobacteria bacterium]|nr:enoyl-CoA hydratase/isomerase family protein [Deltaproteobacteria bacterium]